ncbi:hypothetical protein CLIB1423_18S01134 [[Candida] railenensis]|uniref:RRM domain-containing protein n=1 Tax=[Candida] railenensis TaxID=45579 RepID=A0A9P0W065_9ASCO|nr:hypothetical protein CLIB1423_18S01134 [[Candida] railenensis]
MNSSSDNQVSFILNINKYVIQDVDTVIKSEKPVAAIPDNSSVPFQKSTSTTSTTSSTTKSPVLSPSSTSTGTAPPSTSTSADAQQQSYDSVFPVKLTVSCANNAYSVYKEILKIVSSDEELFKLNLNIKKDIELINSSIIICLATKVTAQKLYQLLHDKYSDQSTDISLKFNYDSCISHPGNIFIKNLSTNLITEQNLFEHFQQNSKYNSLNSVKLFPQDNNESFAFLNFDNHLDADYLISNSSEEAESNPFHHDSRRNIYINRYISRRERKLRQQSKDFVNDELEMNFNGISITSPPVSPPAGLQTSASTASHTGAGNNANSSTSSNNHDYSTIFIENLGQFITEVNPSIESIERVLNKFEIFGEISSAFFPLVPVEDSNGAQDGTSDFKLANFGYIDFEYSENNVNSLKALYYLSDLTTTEFFKFTKKDVYDIKDDMLLVKEDIDEVTVPAAAKDIEDLVTVENAFADEDDDQFDLSDGDDGTPCTGDSQGSTSTAATSVSIQNGSNDYIGASSVKLQLSIGQHKHNSNLYQYNPEQFVFTTGLNFDKTSSIETMSPQLHNTILNKFLKKSNYQETNIYVNNFPILFENDDQLWESFWMQFGSNDSPNKGIKSARIIKPQFYSGKNGKDNASINSNTSVGKIGFVFYQDFKMALRAILLTNNKSIAKNDDNEDHKISISTSFALQKSSHNNSHNNNHSGMPVMNGGNSSGSFSYGSNNGNNVHYFNSLPAYKRFSLPTSLPNGASNSAVVAAATAAAAAALQQHQQQQQPHLPRQDSMMNWQSLVPPTDYQNYYYHPYVNFTYGYPHGFLSSRMSFEDRSPGGPESEEYSEALETNSPPNGLYAPYFQSPPVSSPIFNEAYIDNSNVPQHHPIMYGPPGIPPSAQGPPPHMVPIYPYYSPTGGVNQNTKPVSGKNTRSREKD